MTRKSIQPDELVSPLASYSQVVQSEDLVYISGQIPFDADGKLVSDDFRDQTHQVFKNMKRCLESVDCDFADVIKVMTFIADFNTFQTYDEVYREYFKPPYPARSTIQAGLYGFKIEVEAIARISRRSSR